ncbi:MAG: DegT/DnrJ/EryC1/StrS family aminotransferase, partial [Desulfohalobiaceae bacterium]|nr:DegT/DnrJ/EryC1/StrS family aminotransferase [Desulfohalobiaceae bacterium]
RITDIQCALGLRQFQKLPKFLERRQEIAAKYYEMLRNSSRITPLDLCNGISLSDHAFHLFVAQLSAAKRNQIFKALRNRGIGVNVHYIPVHLHPYYQRKLGFKKGICPKAEFASEKIVSLPIWPGMTDADVEVSAQAILECAQWA